MKRLAVVIYSDVDRIDIDEVKIIDFDDSEDIGFCEDIYDYANWWLHWNYGNNHDYFFDVHEVKCSEKSDIKFYNVDDIY